MKKQKEEKKNKNKRKRLAAAHLEAKTNDIYNVGTVIWKLFDDDELYEGVVTKYNADKGVYSILYDDGDVEQYDEEDMENFFHAAKRNKKPDAKKPVAKKKTAAKKKPTMAKKKLAVKKKPAVAKKKPVAKKKAKPKANR